MPHARTGSSARFRPLLSAAIVALSACGGFGPCSACPAQPLPAGGLPDDQTVEGGGQIRVTAAGFEKLTSVVPGLLNAQLGQGLCLPSQSILGADVCYQRTGPGGRCNPGCFATVGVQQTRLTVTNQQTLNLSLRASTSIAVAIDPPIFSACTLDVTATNLSADLDVGFGVNPSSGELEIRLNRINGYSLSGVTYSGCSVISFLASLVTDLLDSFLGAFVVDLLTPAVNDLIQGFLPDPLGLAGRYDVGGALSAVAPGSEGFMEARLVPGGYVQLRNAGMSLGLVTGLNSDRDPATRTPALDSEPARCVPPFLPPDSAAAPASLPVTARGTFTLAPADTFLGMPELPTDLTVGVSETALDLLGHHLVSSGAACLRVGTAQIAQLELGALALLVPSLGDLGDEDAPVLVVFRPQTPADFSIGDGTGASPALGLHVPRVELDFYPFVHERYARAFTLSLGLDLGLDLEFVQAPGQPVRALPILTDLSTPGATITAVDTDLVRESPEELAAVVPTVLDLVLPLLAGALAPVEVPTFAGFGLENLQLQRVSTAQDDFLAVLATLGDFQGARGRGVGGPPPERSLGAGPARSSTAGGALARLGPVVVPAPGRVRDALLAGGPDGLPVVTVEVARHDDQGRPLEWSWNLDGGLWRPFSSASPLVIADRAFAWQGRYTVGLIARLAGDPRTAVAGVVGLPVVIDSAAPRPRVEAARWSGDALVLSASDAVHPSSELEWAWGRPGDAAPTTGWSREGRITRGSVEALATGGAVQAFVRDPSANVGRAVVRVVARDARGGGGCGSGRDGGPGALLLAALGVALLTLRPRRAGVPARDGSRRRLGSWLCLAAAASVLHGCSCGGGGEETCRGTADCAGVSCPPGQVAGCSSGDCACTADIPLGAIGAFSDVAVGPDGEAVISAYASEHGDLVVARLAGAGRVPATAWEFVDGVPSGPVVVPGSGVRGGILEPGPDVGLHTSVAVSAAGVPMVAYQARDSGSLKFAARSGGVWRSHVVDAGTGALDPQVAGESAGAYAALTLRPGDGTPGVAYLAVLSSGGGVVTAEVRWAEASGPSPASATDWTVTVLDTLDVPAAGEPGVDPLPAGVGLFVDAARDVGGAPTVVYHDRANGALELVRRTAGGAWSAPAVVAGATGDEAWYPSVAVDGAGVAQLAFQSGDHHRVLHLDTATGARTPIDDGYRVAGTTPEGLPRPEFHLVGADAQLVLTAGGPFVVYQDSTSHALVLASRRAGDWVYESLAGDEAPFAGAYGFSASAALAPGGLVISTWVLDPREGESWVEVFRVPVPPP